MRYHDRPWTRCAALAAALLVSGCARERVSAYLTVHEAAALGHVARVEQLLDAEPGRVRARDSGRRTPLHGAAKRGRTDIVRRLLDRGARVNAIDGMGETPLHRAARHGRLAAARLLLRRGARVNAQAYGLGTPLHGAAWNGHLALVKLLVEHGARLDAQDSYPITPLAFAAGEGRGDVVAFLLVHGADPSACHGSAVDRAVSGGHLDMLERLLAAGARAGLDDLLRRAVQAGEEPVARLLLRKGARVRNPDRLVREALRTRNRALIDLVLPHHPGPLSVRAAAGLGRVERVRSLIERSPKLLEQGARWQGRPLDWAIRYDQPAVLRLLLDRGADVHAKHGDHKETLLHRAAWYGSAGAAKVLLEKGADPNAKDRYDHTPLRDAAHAAATDVVRVLLAHAGRAKLEGVGSALACAAREGYPDVVDAFLASGVPTREELLGALSDAVSAGHGRIVERLLARANPTPDELDRAGLLYGAAEAGDVEVARRLVARGASVHAPGLFGRTPLQIAAEHGCLEMAKLLVAHGADVVAKDQDGRSPADLAAQVCYHKRTWPYPEEQQDRYRLVEWLVDWGSDLTVFSAAILGKTRRLARRLDRDPRLLDARWTQDGLFDLFADEYDDEPTGPSALELAVAMDRTETARLLLERGAKLPATEGRFRELLSDAARARNETLARLLLTHARRQGVRSGVLTDVVDAAALDTERLGLLLAYGPDLNARRVPELGVFPEDKNEVEDLKLPGRTPLEEAIEGRQPGRVAALLGNGARVDTRDELGRTPLHYAAHEPGMRSLVEHLIENGADVAARDALGGTALHYAAWPVAGRLDTAELLLARGADPNAADGRGRTALHAAARAGCVPMTRLLLENGADPLARDHDGTAPVDVAAKRMWDPEVLIEFIRHLKSVDVRDGEGRTLLHRAAAQRVDRRNRRYLDATDVAGLLLERGADIRATDRRGRTPLHLAVRANCGAAATLLLARGADVNARDADGRTPLFLATEEEGGYRMTQGEGSRLALVQLLLERGADVSATDRLGWTPLHKAAFDPWIAKDLFDDDAERGANKIVELLLAKGARADATDRHGRTPLHLAAFRRDGATARLLVAKGAKMDIAAAAAMGMKDRVAAQLKAEPKLLDARGPDGWTPLYWAARTGARDVAAFLLGKGADVNAAVGGVAVGTSRPTRGETALHAAALTGSAGVANLLLGKDGRPDPKSAAGRTPLHYAAEQGHTGVARTLLAKGADVNARTRSGRTPLLLALRRPSEERDVFDNTDDGEELVELLVKGGADVNAKDPEGWTPLHRAVRNAAPGEEEMADFFEEQTGPSRAVKLLLDKGARVDATDAAGRTPLHVAAAGNCLAEAEWLLRKWADAGAKDQAGRTAMDAARRRGHLDMMRLLERGPKPLPPMPPPRDDRLDDLDDIDL